MKAAALIVVADDYGRSPAYDAGIVEAVRAGAVDALSAMVIRDLDPDPPLKAGVEVGLHLELPEWRREGTATRRAGPGDRAAAVATLGDQLERFEALFGRPPTHVDGHRHCHAAPGLAAALGREVAMLGLPMRSVGARHRRTLRCLGVLTPDRLVGRVRENEPPLPLELRPLIEHGGLPPPGVTEWMVHPGRRDPAAGSAYDAGREQDLTMVLALAGREDVRALRTTHARALG